MSTILANLRAAFTLIVGFLVVWTFTFFTVETAKADPALSGLSGPISGLFQARDYQLRLTEGENGRPDAAPQCYHIGWFVDTESNDQGLLPLFAGRIPPCIIGYLVGSLLTVMLIFLIAMLAGAGIDFDLFDDVWFFTFLVFSGACGIGDVTGINLVAELLGITPPGVGNVTGGFDPIGIFMSFFGVDNDQDLLGQNLGDVADFNEDGFGAGYTQTNAGRHFLDELGNKAELNGALPLCLGGFTSFTGQCQRMVPGSANVQPFSCPFAFIYLDLPSPISLLWDGRETLNESGTLSQFPLEGVKNNKWYFWKGSSVSPLLVHDPKNTGEVSGAEQLFGTYTFGKRWENGFEALATLDTDKNQIVSGAELKDLRLWFDHNQNSKVEEGELSTLETKGVTELKYQVTASDTKEGDIYVRDGFTRLEGEKKVVGHLVDWYTQGFDSKSEAEQALISNMSSEFKAAVSTPEKVTGRMSEMLASLGTEIPEQFASYGSTEVLNFAMQVARAVQYERKLRPAQLAGPRITGIWEWQMNGKHLQKEFRDKVEIGGLLALRENADGTIWGISSNAGPASNRFFPKDSTYMANYPVKGKKVVAADGSIRLLLEVKGPEGKPTKTEITVNGEDSSFDGVSTSELFARPGETGGPAQARYTWTARKFTVNDAPRLLQSFEKAEDRS